MSARVLAAALALAIALASGTAAAGSTAPDGAEPSGFHPSMVLLWLIPAGLAYDRSGGGNDGLALSLRLPVRLARLGDRDEATAAARSGHVAAYLEWLARFGEDDDDDGQDESGSLRILLGLRAFHSVYRGVGPHLDLGLMADAGGPVGSGGYLGTGVSIGGSPGSFGVDYRFTRGRHDHAHSVGLSFMALIPAW